MTFKKLLLYAVPLLVLVTVGAHFADKALKHRWDKDFKAEQEVVLFLNLMQLGMNPDDAGPMSECIINSIEQDYTEKQARAVNEGRAPRIKVVPYLRNCACNVLKLPAALEDPYFCKRKD